MLEHVQKAYFPLGKALFLLFSLFAMLFIPVPNAFAQQTDPVTIATSGATVLLSDSATVDVTFDASDSNTNIAAFTMSLAYDNTAIDITNCEVTSLSGFCNIMADGEMRLVGVKPDGLVGLATVASITFEGISIGTTALQVTAVETLIDASNENLEFVIEQNDTNVVDLINVSSKPDSGNSSIYLPVINWN